jgi:3-hydroxymyristoyl/3-hydroxydecanoyl-(acyl carrier protein) dehydratase
MNLPPVINKEEVGQDEVILHLSIVENMDVFAGHFPDRPILPGVVQIDWALRLAVQHLNIKSAVARKFQVKFRQIIKPNQNLILKLKRDEARHTLLFTYLSDETIMASGTLRLDDE